MESHVETRRLERRNAELEAEAAALRLKLREAEDAAAVARRSAADAWNFTKLLRTLPRREVTR